MNEHRMQFAIGIVTIMGGFALAAIIIWFGEFQSVFEPRKTYYVVFDYAPGAKAKMPVRRAGIRIGEVRSVEYSERHGKVGLTLVIEGDNELRTGDIPSIGKDGFLGDRYVDIITPDPLQGVEGRQPIASGTTLEGLSPEDPLESIQQMSEVVPTAHRTLLDIQLTSRRWAEVGERANRLMAANEEQINLMLTDTRDAVQRLNTTLENINSMLDPQTQENFRVTFQNIRKSSDSLEPLIKSSQETIEQVRQTTQTLQEVATNLQTATEPLAERSESTMRNLDESLESLNVVLRDVRDLSEQFREGKGTIQKLISDPSMYQNLDEAAILLVRNLSQLEDVLKDAKVFADKIARHPGELGVQGVLTRDTGVKNYVPEQAISGFKPAPSAQFTTRRRTLFNR